MAKVENKINPVVWGGIGKKKSNGGCQWYQQNRIYDTNYITISIATTYLPYYIYEISKNKKCN